MSSMESRVEAAAGLRPIKVGLRFNVAMKQRCYGRSRMLEQFMADPFYNPVVPDHVPPALVHDFNMYDPAEPGEDVFEAFRSLHERGLPEIFWTRTNGAHWVIRSEEHTSELQSLMRISYAVFCLKKKNNTTP